jgi:diguanylate cyclase (GGDEF)-like protein
MADVNPLDALDEAPSAAPASALATAAAPSSNPLDALDDPSAQPNPLDRLGTPPASDHTATRMDEVTDQAQMPTVTVSARGGPDSSWSDVARGIPTAIGAGIETKVGATQEYVGHSAYDDAKKKFWQSVTLPQAVRDAKAQGVALTDLPEVQDAAKHVGVRVDVFTRDWPDYVNMSPQELDQVQREQRDRMQAGAQQIESGSRKRLTAAQVQEAYAPRMDNHSLKALVFDSATMAPDILAGVGGTVATGGVGGAAIMAADIAPNEYAAARNKGLNHQDASTYAILTTVASSVPEVPVLKVVENTPLANKVIGSVVGEKLAQTGVGKVAGTAAAQGVTQSVVNALQQGIDAGVLNEHLPLDEALKQVAWSGLLGATVGAPMGAYHAATSRSRKPTTLQEITETGGGNGREEPQAPSVAPPSVGEVPTPIDTRGEEIRTGAAENISGSAEAEQRAALLAVQDKTVTPPQADLLEQAGLVKRNDLNEPVLLPAGRRRLTELKDTGDLPEGQAENAAGKVSAESEPPVSGTNTASKPLETREKGPIVGTETPQETPKQPETEAKQPEKSVNEEVATEKAPLLDRLRDDQDLRQGLEAMKGETGWAQVGGKVLRDATTDQVTGRTSWIPNSDWWPGRPKGLKEDEVHTAVDKALAGQPLRKREQSMVEYMTQVHDERVAMAATHEELKQAVPDLEEQPQQAVDLTILASRAAEHDPNATAQLMEDAWADDSPETIARVRGQFEQIIGRGQKEAFTLATQEAGNREPAPVKRSPAALDLFGEDRTREQALADETRRRDQLRSPNRDVPLETGLPGDLFSQSRRQVDLTDQLEAARADTNTDPTEAQKAAGNYAKGELSFGGMKVTLENPKGSTRSGVDPGGKRWSRKLAHDYGYLNGSEGADGDHVDTFLTGKPDTGKVFVVNQVHPDTREFDEHKAVLGANSEEEARRTYLANYPRGWKGLNSVAEFSTDGFRRWLNRGQRRRPAWGSEVERENQLDAAAHEFDAQTHEEIGSEPMSSQEIAEGFEHWAKQSAIDPRALAGKVAERLRTSENPAVRGAADLIAQKHERRVEIARRKKVAEMSAEEAKRELLTHELTGIPNRRAYVESEKLPRQVSIDVDSLKAINDIAGHEAGDALLKEVAQVLHEETDHAYHLSGDEFAAQALHDREAHELMERVRDRLKDSEIIVQMPDGSMANYKGLGISYGVGEDLGKADAALQSHKQEREAQGLRAPRGETPRGLAIRRPEGGGQSDRSEARSEKTSISGTETARDRTAAATELFGDRANADAIIDHGLNSLDIERQREVVAQVRASLQNFKIARAVIKSVPISVVHMLTGSKVTSDELARDPTMFSHSLAVATDGSIPGNVRGFIDTIAKAVRAVERSGTPAIAEEAARPKSRRTSVEGRATVAAGDYLHGKTVGLPRASVERIVHQTVREANLVAGFPHVEVHDDVSSLPQPIKRLIEEQGAQSLTGAVYDPNTGRIHLVASNNATEAEVRENLWHEAVGHHGLRMVMEGPQYNVVMDGIARDMPERVQAAAIRSGLDVRDPAQKRAAAEEVIAYAAGQHLSGQPIDKPVVPYWTRAVRAVKAFFARMTGRPFYDDTAIAKLIGQARQALERGTAGTLLGEPARATRAPMFYSPVERAVTESKQGKASAGQWLATLRKTTGVKSDELEWLNLEPWLKEHKGPITKEELADYVRANKLQLEETLHGAGAQTADEREQIRLAELLRAEGHTVAFDNDGNLDFISVPRQEEGYTVPTYDTYSLRDPAQIEELPESIRERVRDLDDVSTHVAARWAAEHEDPTASEDRGAKYGEYTLPGGKNYREMLVRMGNHYDPAQLAHRKTAFEKYASGIERYRQQSEDFSLPLDERQRAQRNLMKLQDIRDAEADKLGPERPTYRSSHWDEPNILAHVRFNERTDPDGKKVLFLEELQSDWHQQGRQHGYPGSPEEIEAAKQKRDAAGLLHSEAGERAAETFRAEYAGSPEEAVAIRRRLPETQKALTEAQRAYDQAKGAVPHAPFKTSWPMLIMKRMVRWAAENGFERIAWTTGKQNAERYSLENRVGEITYQRRGNLYNVAVDSPEGVRIWSSQHSDKETLARYVGQEMADKIERGERTETNGPFNVISGLDLRTGGEGMRGFYDQILPRETDKLIKKYGAKTGPVEVSVGGGPSANMQDDIATGFRPASATAHGFDITPAMKTAALGEGFPMFSRRQQELPLEEQRERGAYAVIRRAVNAVHDSAVARDFRKLANPVGMSPESKQTALVARAALGQLAHETVETQEALEHFSRQVDRMPVKDQLQMMDEIERGVPQSIPEYQPVADEMRKILDTWRGKVQGLGAGYLDNFIENYFPHYWRFPDEAQRMVASIMGRRPLRGPASFLKMRTIPSIKEGMDAGLTPLTTNPLIMTLLKTREMQRFVTGVTLMKRFKEDGLAQFLRAGSPMPDGWAPINDNIAKVRQWSEVENGFIERGQYIMPLEAARVINNHVSASALRDFAPAQIFRRGANALNAMQLGFSAFHLGFTTLDAMISKNAQGIERLMHGEVGKAAQSFGEGLTPVGAFTNVRRGYRLLQAYSDPAGATPEMQKLVRMLEQAGGRAHMDRYYQAAEGFSPFRGAGLRSLSNDVRQALTAPTDKLQNLGRALGSFPVEYGNKLMRGMQEIWATTPKMEVPVEVAMRIVRASTSWIMEHLVPMQKLGVFSDLATDHLRRNPLENPNERAAAMQKIWDSVDNRLGEMVYDNLFWNRTMKDSLHLGIRAVGWNVGTVREIGGAPIDIARAVDKLIRTGKITAQDLGHRIPYVLAMATTTALYGAMYQYMATGQGPQELKDYFFPRSGGVTNYGTPQRVSLPSYVKDVYEYAHRPGTTVVNKLNPIFSLMGNLYSNQDFFGNPITDPEAGYWQQKLQQLQFAGHEMTPFSFQGRQQMEATEQPTGFGAAVKKVLPMVGVTPAPGYITSGEQMERRQRLEADQKYVGELKYKIKKAALAGDKEGAAEITKEYIEARKRMAQTKALVDQDRAKAAAARRKTATSMRQQGMPRTADLVAALPLEPDSAARKYFSQMAQGIA